MSNLVIPGLGSFADVAAYMADVGVAARAAARQIARADTRTKDAALRTMATSIRRDAATLMATNARDVSAAKDAGKDIAAGAEKSARVTIYYTQEAGRKVAHFFKSH